MFSSCWKVYGNRCHCSRPSAPYDVAEMTTTDHAITRRSWLVCAGASSILASLPSRASTVVQVGPERRFKSLAAAARGVAPGARIEVDAGDYVADVAVWEQPDLTIVAVGGRVRLLAGGAAAEGKGIWVVRAENLRAEGFDFEGAVVSSRNGAGIRLERGSLHVVDCRFLHNETGILTSNDPSVRLTVTRCEFGYNLRPDGQSHHLYAGQIAELRVSGSYFHDARIGHLLKTRAAVSRITYNRLTDETTGSASYELEFPNGGLAVVVGNIIEQSPWTDNPYMVRFGAEQLKWTRNELYLVHNTLIDRLPAGGHFLGVITGTSEVVVANNVLMGSGRIETAGVGRLVGNFQVGSDAFEQTTPDDYRLRPASGLLGKAAPPVAVAGLNLAMQAEYVHPRSTQPLAGLPHSPGAVQQLASAPHS